MEERTMAKIKAIKSFSGIVTMRKGMEKEISDDAVAQDLIRAGFAVALDSAKAEKTAKAEIRYPIVPESVLSTQ